MRETEGLEMHDVPTAGEGVRQEAPGRDQVMRLKNTGEGSRGRQNAMLHVPRL